MLQGRSAADLLRRLRFDAALPARWHRRRCARHRSGRSRAAVPRSARASGTALITMRVGRAILRQRIGLQHGAAMRMPFTLRDAAIGVAAHAVRWSRAMARHRSARASPSRFSHCPRGVVVRRRAHEAQTAVVAAHRHGQSRRARPEDPAVCESSTSASRPPQRHQPEPAPAAAPQRDPQAAEREHDQRATGQAETSEIDPGRCETQRPTASMVVDAPAHHLQGTCIEPERHQEHGERRGRHGDEAHDRHGAADCPARRNAWRGRNERRRTARSRCCRQSWWSQCRAGSAARTGSGSQVPRCAARARSHSATATKATTAANDIWKPGSISVSGRSSRMIVAASANASAWRSPGDRTGSRSASSPA